MTNQTMPTGPDLEAVTHRIRETYPDADVVAIEGAVFFSLDADKHFPNFVTIVWIDDFDGDTVSDLSRRPGVFRVNVGVGRETFDRITGSNPDPDPAAFDRFFPHPVYAKQHWISILNPTDVTWRDVVVPLIAEAHDRLAAQRARHRPRVAQAASISTP
jgi:hypothetical protein